MRIEDLTKEQVEQFRACETYEEFMALASEIGLEFDEAQAKALRLIFEDADITEDELKAVAGGADQSAYAVLIDDLVSPQRWRTEAMKYSNYFNWL